MSAAAEPEPNATGSLWQLALAKLSEHPLTRELWPRDRPRLDETLLELFLLGERPSVSEVRTFLAGLGTSDVLAREAVVRWRRRLKNPGWRPREHPVRTWVGDTVLRSRPRRSRERVAGHLRSPWSGHRRRRRRLHATQRQRPVLGRHECRGNRVRVDGRRCSIVVALSGLGQGRRLAKHPVALRDAQRRPCEALDEQWASTGAGAARPVGCRGRRLRATDPR